MALMSNKTAIESILGNFEKKHVDAIYNAAAQTLIAHSDFRNKHFAYALNSYQKRIASKLGIELYPNGYMPHSHPLSKIFENHLLFDVLPSVVNTSKLIMCSIKESKVLIFKNRITGRAQKQSELASTDALISPVSFVNRLVSSKDVSRYTEEADAFFSLLNPKGELFSNNFIKSLSGREAVFFHDEVHHWSKKQMFSFLKRTRVKRFIFTIVYPPEILKKFANSQNPKVYDFQVHKGKLFFFPDGVRTEAYEQQLNLHWLFSASHLKSGDHTWTVTRHKSIYAHHLFEITAGDLITDSKIFFSDYNSIDMSKLFLDRFRSYDVFPISIEHLYKVYSYLLCLKKPDLESGLAKLRQIIGDDVEIKEFLFFEQFCKRLIKRQTSWGLFGYSFMEKITDMALSKMPNVIARMFPQWKDKNTFEFLFSLGTLQVEVERHVCYEHVLEEWGFEVVVADENAYLDPLSIFALNENFNEERVDDGYLDRVRLPFWNMRDYDVKRGRANKYDLLCHNFSLERDLENKPNGPHKMLQIEWYGIKCFEPDVFISNSIYEFTMLELLIGKKINPSKYSFKKQANVLEFCLKQVCKDGYEVYSMDLWLEELLQIEGHDEKEVGCELKGDKEVGDSSETIAHVEEEPNGISPFVLDIDALMVSNCDSAFDCDYSTLEPNGAEQLAETSRGVGVVDCLEENMSLGQSSTCAELKGISTSFEIDYHDIFNAHDCNMTHGDLIRTPSDGNCFFHAFAHTFECENFKDLRASFADWLLVFNHGKYADQSAKVRPEGVWMEAEWIYLFCIFREVSLVVHDISDEIEKVFIIHKGFTEGHIAKRGDHFLGIETYSTVSLFPSILLKDCPAGFDQRLTSFKMNPTDFNCFKFRGRLAAFLTNVDADYGHNGMMYPFNSWVPSLDAILEICGMGNDFNCALINFYEAGSSLGYHRDNEKVYNDDPILTVGLQGEGLFRIEYKNDAHEFQMVAGSFFLMPKGFQKKSRHSVVCETSRVSITFRKHVRRMDGTPIAVREDKYQNMCLINAISTGMNRSSREIISRLKTTNGPAWGRFLSEGNGGSIEDCQMAAEALSITIELMVDGKCFILGSGGLRIAMLLSDNHFSNVKIGASVPKTFVSHMARKGSFDVTRGLREELASKVFSGYNELQFIARFDHARVLTNSFLNFTTGISLSRTLDNGEKYFNHILLQDCASDLGFDVIAICGFAGSGKSRVLQNWLHGRKKSNFCVVSPRANLANDWSYKLELEPSEWRKVMTFEKFIKSEKSKLDLIVIDELTLFPNGYLDLLIFELMQVNQHCTVVLLFDPLQARYHSKLDESILTFEHDVDRLISGVDLKYIYSTYRMSPFFNRFCDVPCLNDEPRDASQRIWFFDDVYSISSQADDRNEHCDVLLVESDLEKKAFSSVIEVMTFGESQGLTFDHVCILLSESSASSNEYRWMVALTRARKRVSLCCTFLGGIDEFKIKKKGGLIISLLENEIITFESLNLMLKCNLIKDIKKNGCHDEVDREERLSGDPFLKPFIFLGQRIAQESCAIADCEPDEPRCQTHLFITEPNFGLCYNFDFIKEKEQREYREDMLVTNQFCDSYEKTYIRGKRETAGPLRFKAIYPKHSADDDMTFWMAVKKRLVFREEEENYQRLQKAHLIGGLLYQNFKKKWGCHSALTKGCLRKV
uniref:RdRp n=1 Tax=Humulus lupulus citrivirus 1 TaxID=2794430 RepID=A0A7T5QZG4_9VIRU|nr:RdRp [Humulus lupulus citrivirus 1]